MDQSQRNHVNYVQLQVHPLYSNLEIKASQLATAESRLTVSISTIHSELPVMCYQGSTKRCTACKSHLSASCWGGQKYSCKNTHEDSDGLRP